MRRLMVLALALAAFGVAPAAARTPGRMMVTAREFSFVSSRQTLPAGTSIVQLVNGGEDAHDLALRRVGGTGKTVLFPETKPGAVTTLKVKLKPGRYRLWCTLPGHRAAGMRATLRVR